MKYILFSNSVLIDTLREKGVEVFLDDALEFHCMIIDGEDDYLLALKKVERYGSFAFISERKYNQLLKDSDE